MSSTQGQSPPPVWSSTCARVKRRRRRRCGQSSRSSRPDVPTAPPKSSTKGGPFYPTWNRCGPPDRRLKPATHLPSLSRLCTHRERRCASFQFNSRLKRTLLEDGVCGERGDGVRRLEGNGWEPRTHTHHILRTAWGVAGMLASVALIPPIPTSGFQQEGSKTCPNTGTPATYHAQLSLLILVTCSLVR